MCKIDIGLNIGNIPGHMVGGCIMMYAGGNGGSNGVGSWYRERSVVRVERWIDIMDI